MKKIIVGILTNSGSEDKTSTYAITQKYVNPVINVMQAVPILIPCCNENAPYEQWLNLVDGILLTGGKSDIHPRNYGQEITNKKSFFDHKRDEVSFNLIKLALAKKIPVLGICRGFEEINVVLGGTLKQSVHILPQHIDHREHKINPYALQHEVEVVAGGRLSQMFNQQKFMVNSLHDQGIDQLATNLQVEAYAKDGLIEAFSLQNSTQFLFATQWHIEWETEKEACSKAIFSEFKNACEEYSKTK
jgi:putative glutamine amidotransferase